MVSQLGEFLRQQREARGISLEELHARTKIRVKYLKAIEAGDYAEIPGEVYLRGFIRSMAKELDIDPHEAMELYHQEVQSASEAIDAPETEAKPVAEAPEQPATTTVKEPVAAPEPEEVQKSVGSTPRSTTPSRSHKKKRNRATPRLVWLLLLAAVVVGGIFYWDRLMGQPIAEDPNVLPPDNGNNQEAPAPDPDPEPPSVKVELQNPGEANPIYHVTQGPLEVLLQAEGGACWVGASADGGPQQQATLRPDGQISSLTVEAENDVVVRVGNPSALRLVINGIDQGIIGGGSRAIDLRVRVKPSP